MGSSSLVDGVKVSTVVPGRVSGQGKVTELKGRDLAMKLHYIRALYFFENYDHNNNNNNNNDSFVSVGELKSRHMFEWLETYFMTCGRVRAPIEEGAPPVMKFNDAGIRVVEAESPNTLDHCLSEPDLDLLTSQLIPSTHVLGPDLPFSPLVFLQMTWFSCGGVAVGLSWAHLIGDAFAASTFMNMLGKYLQGQLQPKVLSLPNSEKPVQSGSGPLQHPLSVKRVEPVGDCWMAPMNQQMSIYSFRLTEEQVGELEVSVKGAAKGFEAISGVVWKCIAKTRKEKEPKVVTVCRPKTVDREGVVPYNGQVITTVKAECGNVATVDVAELAGLIAEKTEDESEMVAEKVEAELGSSDFLVYGSNLTFIDMEEAPIYGFELKGRHPVFAAYTVGGTGDEGVVVVQPGPTHASKLVIVMLPQFEIEQFKLQINNYWPIL
ncbi:protein ECERIFERUM 2-like [Silene latifolia]|uniref:protein ECERIFERUM 2-like n=1 Tax=Silene latifolia TaxID=37657 RepID=UPI003D76C3B2